MRSSTFRRTSQISPSLVGAHVGIARRAAQARHLTEDQRIGIGRGMFEPERFCALPPVPPPR